MITRQQKVPEFLLGGGEMGERIRNFDWANNPLGPPETWEQSLRTCVRIMLTSSQPIWIGWGPQLIKLYNDPYKAIVGGKHPVALGQPASIVWSDIWKDIGPMLRKVMENDEGTYVESQLLIMERNNYPEETYYTFSYTPIPGDNGGTGGMICANTDDTARIINERALKVLRDMGKLSYREKTIPKIYSKATKILAENNKDFPLALIYQINESDMTARAVSWAGDKSEYNSFPEFADLSNPSPETRPLADTALSDKGIIFKNLNGDSMRAGFWPIPPKQAAYIPLRVTNRQIPCAILVVGLNPYRKVDADYQQFIKLIGDQLSLEMNIIAALEEERKRAESLAQLDKAKTLFFNNISHEFRTPLTLMLGPLEELLLESDGFSGEGKANIETAHRNALRLLKLVNTLLDFSRLENGRLRAQFASVDIALFTRSLASAFQSVIEKAGLSYVVEIENVPSAVYVDKQMWEKIVFNLLSNAFKFTLHGTITVRLCSENNSVVLKVSDTGCGVPANELPNMFKRFHRIQGSNGRTFEGSGIGLSMIKELVASHGGEISVDSTEGKGTTFTVTIPTGNLHLDPEQIIADNQTIDSISNIYVDEAATFLADGVETYDLPETPASSGERPRILVVDDNADMRDYISNLLRKSYEIATAINGADALEKIAEVKPMLILSDIMMPGMDGLEMLKALKEMPQTQQIPVILLSARAGEEARIHGYDTGADDYLVKPFSARELNARVAAQLKIARTRQNSERQLRNLFLQAPVAIAIFRGPSFVVEVANEKMLDFWGKTSAEVLNKPIFEAIPLARNQGYEEILSRVYTTGERFVAPEMSILQDRHGNVQQKYIRLVYEALRDEDGTISGIMELTTDITSEVEARKKIEESEKQLTFALDGGEMGTFDYFPLEGKLVWSDRTREFFGADQSVEPNFDVFLKAVHPEDREKAASVAHKALVSGGDGIYDNEYRTVSSIDGKTRWLRAKAKVVFDENGTAIRMTGVTQDISKQKAAEERNRLLISIIEESNEFIGLAALDGSIRYGNPAALEKLGWDTYENRDIIDCVYPEDRALAAELIPQLLTDGSFQNEIRFYNEKTMQPFWLQWNVFVIQDDAGKMISFGTVSTDITERKIAELALRESELRFRSLADQSPMFIYIIEPDKNAHISYFNRAWLRYTGQTIDQALGRAWDGIVHPDDVPTVLAIYAEAYKNKEPYVLDAIRIRNSEGAYRWFTFKSNPRFLEDGTFAGYIGVGFDIHERKVAEEKLRESEERFRTLAQKLPQLVWVTDKDGNSEFESARWREYSGIHCEESPWNDIVHPDDFNSIERKWRNSLKTGQTYKAEARLRDKSGNYRWHSVLGEPVFDGENNIVKWVGAFTDIQNEKSISQDLEKLVEERTNELVLKNETLEQMNKELESFAYISSHDLQEPLRKIQTFASRIVEHDHDTLSDKAKDYFARMENAALRMKTLIEDLLAYSRTSTVDKVYTTTHLNDIVEEIKQDFSEDIEQKHAVIEAEQMCDVYIIPFQFRQLMHNLIANSLKFAKPDEPPHIVITSEIATGDTFHVDKLNPSRTYCHISVSDNGIGFASEYKEKIFEVFQRLHTRETYIGTGIGLAIVKKIVDNHDGVITATGEANEGATFDIYLPAAAE